MGRDCLSWCCHETNMTSHKALEEQTMMPHCRVCFLQSSEDHLCSTRYVCQRVPCERKFLQSSSWVMGRSKGPHARRVAKEGRKASNGTAYSFQQVLCSLLPLPPPNLSLIAFLIQTHRPLQKRERTGKKYDCFPFFWKTKIFKWKINYILESLPRIVSIWSRTMAKW